MARQKSTRERLASRACDSCKVRKIRCTEVAPCAGCVKSGIECTFKRSQIQRGPRGLRPGTVRRIDAEQREGGSSDLLQGGSSVVDERERLHVLLTLVNVYAARLFPVWPIIDTTKLKQKLLAKNVDHGTRRFAYAVGLATVAQLKLSPSWYPTPEEVGMHGASVSGGTVNPLDDIRVSFFLHIHHENLAPGGRESLLFLREAVTQAQMLKLEHETTYPSFPDSEQHIYRRILWLLFVTERGVALLHELPPILKPKILFPWHSTLDETPQVLPAFLKLVQLFWTFDQSGLIDIILQNTQPIVSNFCNPLAKTCLELLHPKLQESISDDDWGSSTDVQRADVFLTRQWMRSILWRAAFRFGVAGLALNPIDVAREFLSLVARLPAAALESHGATLEFKTFEIATTVVDAIASNCYPSVPVDFGAATLFSLQRLLSSFRGRNDALLAILEAKMRTSFGFGTLNQQLNLDYPVFSDDTEEFGEDWIPEGILSQDSGAFSTPSLGHASWVTGDLATTFDRPLSPHAFLNLGSQGAVDALQMQAPKT